MTAFVEFALLVLLGLLVSLLGPLWARLRPSRTPEGREPVLSPGLGVTLFAILCLGYVMVFGNLAVRQHLALRSQAFDLGIFDQVVWNSAHGRLYLNSLMSDSPLRLGHHLSLTLLAVVPLYWLWSDPRVLLILQTVLLGLGAVPIYLSGQKRLGSAAAVSIAACYLLYPALSYVNLFDFHEVSIAVPLLALALYFTLEERWVPLGLCLAAILLTKEDMSVVIIAFGLYFAIVKRKPWPAAGLISLGVLYLIVAIQWIIPSFQLQNEYVFAGVYAYLGDSPPEILLTVLTRPQVVLQHVLTPDNARFVLRLLVPLIGLPLAGPEISLVALPSLAYLLISDDSRQTSIQYHYTAVLIPTLFFALILGIRRITVRWPTVRTSLLVALLVVSLGSYYLHGRGPLSRGYRPSLYATSGRAARGRALLAQIPATAPVSAQNNLGAHLSQRDRLYLFPEVFDAEYIVLDLAGDCWPLKRGTPGTFEQAVTQLRSSPAWQLLRQDGDFLLFGQKALPNPVRYTLGDCVELNGYDLSQSPANLRVRLFWRPTCRMSQPYTVFNHLVRLGDPEGHVLAQADGQPVQGTYPTSVWEPGRITVDEYVVPLPPDLEPGNYALRVGMYLLPDGGRLPVKDGAGQAIGDYLTLATPKIAR